MPGGRGLCAALLAAGLLAFSPVLAQDQNSAPNPRAGASKVVSAIVTLDRDRLFEESQMGKAFQARVNAETSALVAENRKLEAALEAEERALTDRRRALSPAEFIPLSDEFDARVEALRTAQDAKSRALTRSNEAEQQRFFQAAVPVLGQLMVDLDAVAIIDRSAIVLSFDQIDITDQAIARLDTVLGDGTAEVGATPPQPDAPQPDPPRPVPNPVLVAPSSQP